MNESITFGNWLLENYIAIQGGWWARQPFVMGRAIPTSELYDIFLQLKYKSWDRSEGIVNKVYQILAGAIIPNGKHHINSVKRLSDSEIFNIGDNVWVQSFSTIERFHFIIGKFEVEPYDNLMVTPYKTSVRFHISLLNKTKQPFP